MDELLLVEDDKIYIVLIKRLLEKHYKVTDINNISTINEQLQSKDYKAILLDLNVLDSSGIDTIKTVARVANKPIVIISALSDLEIFKESIKLGAQDYLVKGTFDRLALVKSIVFAIERYQNIELENQLQILQEDMEILRLQLKHLHDELIVMKEDLHARISYSGVT